MISLAYAPKPPALLLLLVMLLSLFAVSHGRAEAPASCFDDLQRQWNEFATDANQHVQTLEAQPARREKTHRKLDHEWASLRALECW